MTQLIIKLFLRVSISAGFCQQLQIDLDGGVQMFQFGEIGIIFLTIRD